MRLGTYDSDRNSYGFNVDLSFNKKYFSDRSELISEVERVYKSKLGLVTQVTKFIAVDNLGNMQEVDSEASLPFKIVETPSHVLFWWVTSSKVIPVLYIEPHGWEHPDYCSYLVETATEYILENE